jgi:hypothetical protein
MRYILLSALLMAELWCVPIQAQAAPPLCNAGSEGTLVYDADHKAVVFCNGTQWIAMGGMGNSGSLLPACPQGDTLVVDGGGWVCSSAVVDTTSCKSILNTGGSTGNGVYAIDPDGNGGNASFNAYCDMSSDGGGWMLAIKSQTQDKDSTFWSQAANLNLADCLSVSSPNDNNCKNNSIYTLTSWTSLRAQNISDNKAAMIAKNAARTSLYDHFNGAALADANIFPFMTALYGNQAGASMGSAHYWNGTGAGTRNGKMITDGSGYYLGVIGGYSGNACFVTASGNFECGSAAKKIWLWVR